MFDVFSIFNNLQWPSQGLKTVLFLINNTQDQHIVSKGSLYSSPMTLISLT